jgi:hypothetical protein
LEDDYGLDGLANGVVASFGAMLGDRAFDDPIGLPRRAPREIEAGYLDQLRALHGLPAC